MHSPGAKFDNKETKTAASGDKTGSRFEVSPSYTGTSCFHACSIVLRETS